MAPTRLPALLPLLLARASSGGRVGVLCHGYHCGAPNWDEVVWGAPPLLLGRLPTALAAAAAAAAAGEEVTLVVGSGASADAAGRPEAEAELALATERCGRLHADFPDHFSPEDVRVATRVLERALPDTASSNTAGELAEAARTFAARGCTRVVLVSSPAHLPRVLRDAPGALAAAGMWPLPHGGLLCGVPSATSWGGCTAADVAVVEPPHLPTDGGTAAAEGELALHRLVHRALRLPPERRAAFARQADELLAAAGV